MADKAISELVAANHVTPTDLFVLEQSGTAKKLTGATLENWLLDLADGHGGIRSIAKLGTNVLVDTYRITLSDDTTFDFTVTNGKAISSVEQSSVNGLTRTYTISFNDGSSQSFNVTDGRSIVGFNKTSSSGLNDVYTLTYNDETTDVITVKNGRGISDVKKVSTSGLTDTYELSYNDNTSYEFTVTNGEKGDKGDNTYTHIKFASQEPTEESGSIGDVPDRWIGIYWGGSPDAPDDWAQYVWYQFKGDKGDTGNPATLLSSSVEYQASDSGTIIPSGSWSTSIPIVAQGKYLWTRIVQTFNTGDPVTAYTVSRTGIDGLGSVVSVAGISPDPGGNVHLTAEDIGALAKTGGTMSGAIDMNGQMLKGINAPQSANDAASKGYVDAGVKNAAPRNLLDNSNFANPVNQMGETEYPETGTKYTIDRWKTWGAIAIEDGCIAFTNTGSSGANNLYQYFEIGTLTPGKTYTAACMLSDGTICVGSGVVASGSTRKVAVSNDGTLGLQIASNYEGLDHFAIRNEVPGAELRIVWAALYEGEYNAETLPVYKPKNYSAELLECQRYYYQIDNYTAWNAYKSTALYAFIPLPVKMRINPTVSADSWEVRGSLDSEGAATNTATVSTAVTDGFGNMVRVSFANDGKTNHQIAIVISRGLKISAVL